MALLMTVLSMAFAYHETPISVGDVARAVWRPVAASGLLLIVTPAVLRFVSEQETWLRSCVLVAAGLYAAVILGASPHVRRDLGGISRVLRR